VRGVTLTGSGRAGSIVGAQAGRAVKPCVLELGANDGFIVMPSADMDAAIEAAVKARTQNNGQSCIAGKRFFVHQDIYSEFRDRFVAAFEALKVGDPMDRSVDIGPIATQSGLRELGEQVSQAEKVGAHTLIGAKEIDGPGFFFQPGILDNVACNSPMYREEVFGPVAALIEATNLTDAIRKCNDSYYGLGSVLFTQDEGEMARACEEIESGATFINQMVVSDPRLPFGGVKESGIGRELGVEGMRAFQNTKTISRPV